MEPDSRKRRFSNFDVTPEQVSTPNLISSFLSQQHSSILQISNSHVFSDGLFEEGGIFVDPVFNARLEKAMERNFEYILR